MEGESIYFVVSSKTCSDSRYRNYMKKKKKGLDEIGDFFFQCFLVLFQNLVTFHCVNLFTEYV